MIKKTAVQRRWLYAAAFSSFAGRTDQCRPKKIIEYISSHTDVFLFMTIGQLSASLGLSDATVSRFARHVGCKDFKELKHVVIQQSTEHRPVQKK